MWGAIIGDLAGSIYEYQQLRCTSSIKDIDKIICDNCFYALFTSDSFDESILKVISYGGDTDTNACIVGSMAEAMYGIDNSLIMLAKEKIPDTFVKNLELGYNKIKK